MASRSSLMKKTDAELLEAWMANDKTAYDVFLDRHGETLRRFFINKVHEDAVSDLIQETMLACATSVANFQGDSTFRTFLLGLARDQLLRHYRRKDRKNGFRDPFDSEIDPGMSGLHARHREQALIFAALRTIPIDYQVILKLFFWEDLTAQECAEVLGLGLGTVKGRLVRAKRALREALVTVEASPADKVSVSRALEESIMAGSPRGAEKIREWEGRSLPRPLPRAPARGSPAPAKRPDRSAPDTSPRASWWTRPTSPRVLRGVGLGLVLTGLTAPWAAFAAGWLDAPPSTPSRPPTPRLEPAPADVPPEPEPTPTPAPTRDLFAEATNLRPALLRVPAGTFTMGSPDGEGADDEHPAHPVTLPSFLVCETEVTQAQYRAVTGASPSFCGEGDAGCGDDYPMNQVSWDDACTYMNRLTERENAARSPDQPALTPCYVQRGDTWEWRDRHCTGYRLPTEAEWEYAARAGTQGAYSFEGGEDKLGKYAWFGADFNDYPHAVSKKLPNPWGLVDIHGNVWEWCWDWYDPGWYAKKSDAPSDMSYGPDSGEDRVLRGGAFVNTAGVLRSARRYRYTPSLRNWDIGFRCVRGSPSSVDP